MPYITYEDWNPSADTLTVLAQARRFAETYAAQGYNLTLRQLYYRFVAADLIRNEERSYKRLGSIINRGRMSGYIDWDHIEDRTRNLRKLPTWNEPEELLDSARRQYREDIWRPQPIAVEVWVEKDALIDVVGRAANAWDVPYFSCRGYVSQSEMWAAGQRMVNRLTKGQRTLVLHLGDHDPSGMDMTRDINDRLHTFVMSDSKVWQRAEDDGYNSPYNWAEHMNDGAHAGLEYPYSFEVRRIALNMDQIDQYDPPPNPAKLTDSRSSEYLRAYGHQSWELDALEPQVLDDLIQAEIAGVVDMDLLMESRDAQEANRDRIAEAIAGMSLEDEEE